MLNNLDPIQVYGKITKMVGLVVESEGPVTNLGCVCDIYGKEGERITRAEVLGFRDNHVLLMPLEEVRGISPGCRVIAREDSAYMQVGMGSWVELSTGLETPLTGKDLFLWKRNTPCMQRR